MAGRPVKTRTAANFEGEIQSLQRLRTAILMGRPTRAGKEIYTEAADKALTLIDGLTEVLLCLKDGAR